MGKIISLINTTSDGSVDAQYAANIDAEFFEFTHSLMAEAQAVVFGRNTFEWWQDVWQTRLDKESNPDWVAKNGPGAQRHTQAGVFIGIKRHHLEQFDDFKGN